MRQGEYSNIQNQLSAAQASGNAEMRKLEEELAQIQALVSAAKLESVEVQQELSRRTDKITNMRNTITSLTSSAEDRIAREKEVALERERVAKDRQTRHDKECEMLRDAIMIFEGKSKDDLDRLKTDLKKKEEDRLAHHAEIKKAKELEIDSLTKELAQRKAEFAAAISKATTEASECRRTAEDAVVRLGNAEALQRRLEVHSKHLILVPLALCP